MDEITIDRFDASVGTGATDAPTRHAPEDDDLSSELRTSVARHPGEVVRCRRVSGRFYRCNWWRSVAGDGAGHAGNKDVQLPSTYRVGRSAFVEVIRTPQGLRITEVPAGRRQTPID